MQVAIIGLGRWGSVHRRVLEKLQADGLISKLYFCDTEVEGEGIYPHWKDLPHVDAAVIATPPESHAQLAQEMMEKGIHLLVEKPLGTCEAQAAQVLTSAQEHGILLSVGLLLRFHSGIRMAIDQIQRGAIGKVHHVSFSRHSRREAPDGIDVLDALGIHAIDTACHILGEVEPSGLFIEHKSRTKAEFVLEFPNQIESSISVQWDSDEELKRIEIEGSNGTLVVDMDIYDRIFLDGQVIPTHSTQSPLEAEWRHFLSCCELRRSGRMCQPTPTPGAALRGVRWTERVIQQSLYGDKLSREEVIHTEN